MIARAVGMRDMLRDDQEAAERRGYYSEEIHEAFKAAGFYRMLQPRMFGGYEFDLVTYYRISTEIARGGSAGMAWCLGLASHHAFIIGSFFPEQAQRAIHVNGRESERIRDITLPDRQRTAQILRQSSGLRTGEQLTEQMCATG